MLLAKRLQRFRQEPQVRRDRKPDGDGADRVAAQLLELVPGALHVVEDGGGAPHERLAERRRHHAPGAALEQRRAELAFELGEAPRKRRLGDAEVARRGAQAAAFGDGRDGAELGELHGVDPSDTELLSPGTICHLAAIPGLALSQRRHRVVRPARSR